jgi:LPXTG-motif cell wall-anchored protein
LPVIFAAGAAAAVAFAGLLVFFRKRKHTVQLGMGNSRNISASQNTKPIFTLRNLSCLPLHL